jgi:hypothetical protein
LKIESIWTQNEGYNVLYALRKRFGDKAPRTLIKWAVRDYVELLRKKRMGFDLHLKEIKELECG